MYTPIAHILMVSYTIVCITLSLFARLLKRELPLIMARTIWAPIILKICGVKLKVKGSENIEPNTPYIYMVNHISHLDIPVAIKGIEDNLHFVGKKSLLKVPFLGWYMRANSMIAIDRSDRVKAIESLKEAGRIINEGRSVIIYPEGTRSKTGEIGVFKKGGFHIALNAKVNIIPVNISGTDKVWKPTSAKINYGGDCTITIGKPIDTSKYDIKLLNNFVENVKQKVVELG